MAALVLAITAVAGVAAGCGGGDGDKTLTVGGQQFPERRFTTAVQGLCDARADVPGDLTGARAAFYDRSHEMLHVLAAALEPVDRPQAARLLEAKQAVESGLAAPSPPSTLVADLDRLVDVTDAGLERLGMEARQCAR